MKTILVRYITDDGCNECNDNEKDMAYAVMGREKLILNWDTNNK